MTNLAELTAPTYYVDSDAAVVQDLAATYRGSARSQDPKDVAIALFEGVRDGLRYDPYTISFQPDDYRASVVAAKAAAWCVPKAILLAAVARASGIPAAVGFADVRNHLNSPKLQALLETDLFIYHGYVTFWLDGAWIKVTPAFNMEMCERFGVKPLVFDGANEALFHEFDAADRRHMEYVNDRGYSAEPPIDRLLADFSATYPKMSRLFSETGSIRTVDDAFHAGPPAGPGPT